MSTTIIYTNTNEELGVEARVAEIDRGFSVTICDTDADEVFACAMIYPTVERAIEAADKAVT